MQGVGPVGAPVPAGAVYHACCLRACEAALQLTTLRADAADVLG